MACEAVRNALADAGLDHSEISGVTSYQAFDSSPSKDVGSALGMRLDYSWTSWAEAPAPRPSWPTQ